MIDIHELRVLRGGLPPRVFGLVLEWAFQHRLEVAAADERRAVTFSLTRRPAGGLGSGPVLPPKRPRRRPWSYQDLLAPVGARMRSSLDPRALQAVYDRAAGYYNRWHALATAHADQRGRRMLVRGCVRSGDQVLDAGGGTGLTSKLAAAAVGQDGHVVLLDFSRGMLRRALETGVIGAGGAVVDLVMGDMSRLPFPEESFDVVLSTYSVCPLEDPTAGTVEMYRMVKPGGLLGVAHSDEPTSGWARWLGSRVEDLVWKWPQASLGCRSVSVLPELKRLGARVVTDRQIGVPLWPFRVFVVEKPAN